MWAPYSTSWRVEHDDKGCQVCAMNGCDATLLFSPLDREILLLTLLNQEIRTFGCRPEDPSVIAFSVATALCGNQLLQLAC